MSNKKSVKQAAMDAEVQRRVEAALSQYPYPPYALVPEAEAAATQTKLPRNAPLVELIETGLAESNPKSRNMSAAALIAEAMHGQ
jgi:hypothetical protein